MYKNVSQEVDHIDHWNKRSFLRDLLKVAPSLSSSNYQKVMRVKSFWPSTDDVR